MICPKIRLRQKSWHTIAYSMSGCSACINRRWNNRLNPSKAFEHRGLPNGGQRSLFAIIRPVGPSLPQSSCGCLCQVPGSFDACLCKRNRSHQALIDRPSVPSNHAPIHHTLEPLCLIRSDNRQEDRSSMPLAFPWERVSPATTVLFESFELQMPALALRCDAVFTTK